MPYYQEDRFFAPDIEAASQLLASGCLNALLPPGCCRAFDTRPGRSAGALQQEQQQESRGMTHDTGFGAG